MFLWASLVVQELKETPTEDVLETLELIPEGIVGLYTHLLRKIPRKSVRHARLIFMAVVHAPRQMSITELAITCLVKESHRTLSSIPSHVIENFENDIKLCGPILKVRKSPNLRKRLLSVTCGNHTEDIENTVAEVQLVHQSAKEFLLEASESGKSLFQSSKLPELYTPAEARRHLAVTCLSYVSFDDFEAGQLQSKAPIGNTSSFELTINTDKSLAVASRLLDFTAQSWVQLCNDGDSKVWATFNRLAKSGKLKFAFKFHHDSRLENVSQTLVRTGFRPWDRYMSEVMIGVDPVFLAIYFGIFVERILDEPDKPSGYLASRPEMLTLAAALGHSDVVKLLLLRGADIDAKDGAALKGAVKQGRHDMIALLPKHGANVEPKDIDTVEVTAKAGRKDLVAVLIRRGVDINGNDGKLIDTAFDLRWDEDIILLLLQHCIYIAERGTEYLDEAAALGHPTVVKYLLRKEVDVNGIS